MSQEHNSSFAGYGGKKEMLPYLSFAWEHDPKHVVFQLARYKFVSKMVSGKVIEVGCGDGYALPILLDRVDSITGIDITKEAIANGTEYYKDNPKVNLQCENIVEGVKPEFIATFDFAYSLDVIEHVDKSMEDAFVGNTAKMLKDNGAFIIGTPNVYAEAHASEASKAEHINLHSHQTLKVLLEKYFTNVFLFSMNDEVLHVGFEKMAHYVMLLATGPKKI